VSESTRERVIAQAMRLFGEQGYASTSVAQIESAAGLKPGSGGLYRHFASKRDVLDAGVRAQLATQGQLMEFLRDPNGLAQLPLRERLTAIAKAALDRLDRERDLNRIVLRDLREFPDLASLVRNDEMTRVQAVLAGWLRRQAESADTGVDWDALAAVLMGSVSHYWVLRDSMNGHPSGVPEERYLAALADLVVARLA
jgi:AcrR family transcriptional regulator